MAVNLILLKCDISECRFRVKPGKVVWKKRLGLLQSVRFDQQVYLPP